MKKKKKIGVVGGIGPEASANLYLKMIHYMQNRYNAVKDSDYPPMAIENVSMEGFDETGIVDADLVRKQLIDACQNLERGGSELIIIACNTVHLFADDVVENINVPLLNIIEEAANAVHRANQKCVGLLCSESTNEYKLYSERYFGSTEVIYPTEAQQNKLNAVIEAVMAGRHGKHEIILLKEVMIDMVNKGAEGIVLGCTEIPLAINQSHTDIHVFDSLELIIRAATDFSV